MNLKQRIIWTIVLLLSITLSCTIILLTWNAQTTLLKQKEQDGIIVAQLLAQISRSYESIPKEVEQVLGEQMLVEATLAAHLIAIANQAGLTETEINQHLRQITDNTVLDEIWISDEQGLSRLNTKHILFNFHPDPNVQPQAYIFWDLLNGKKQTIIQEAMQREIDKQHFKYAAVAGIDKPRIVQVGYHAELIKQLKKQLGLTRMIEQLLKVGQIEGIWMLDNQLTVLAMGHHVKDSIASIVHESHLPEALSPDDYQHHLNPQEFSFLKTTLETNHPISYIENHVLKVIAPLHDHDGKTMGATLIHLSIQQVQEALQQQMFIAIIIAVLTLGLGIVAAIVLAERLSRPLQQLTLTAEALANQEWHHPIPVQRTDEIGRLARAFQTMTINLKDAFDTLEAKVAERTNELRQANEEIQALNDYLQEENVRMEAELEVTRQFQQMILPKHHELTAIQELEIAGFMQPADEVGGDYYDVLHYGERIRIAIGDVTGHGLASGMLMLMVQMAVRTLFINDVCQPKSCLIGLNRAIYDNIQRMGTDKNLTLTLIDYYHGHVDISGQHEDVLIVRKSGVIEHIDTTPLGFFVGVIKNIDSMVNNIEAYLESGDGIVLYTDGITETMTKDGHLYGLERLCHILSYYWQLSALEIQQAVIADLKLQAENEHFLDDLTLVVIKKK